LTQQGPTTPEAALRPHQLAALLTPVPGTEAIDRYPRVVTFDEALNRHLTAVRTRDLSTLDDTLHDEVCVLLPGGALVCGRDAVRQLHHDWFADTGWSISFEPVVRTVVEGTASVLLDVHYTDVDDEGRPVDRDYFLGLTFAAVDGRWLLVFDQNSVVR
jgi:ketosteroid isomerase-like protein